jgi:hypothetical protein
VTEFGVAQFHDSIILVAALKKRLDKMQVVGCQNGFCANALLERGIKTLLLELSL